MNTSDFLKDPEIQDALREYYETHVTHHTLSNGTSVAVTAEGRHEPDAPAAEGEADVDLPSSGKLQYVDEARNLIFSLDPANGEVEFVSDYVSPHNSEVKAVKEDLLQHLNAYVNEDYKEGSCLPTIFVDGDSELTLRINISCHSLNLKNFWGGEWLSTWDIMHTVGEAGFQLVGKI